MGNIPKNHICEERLGLEREKYLSSSLSRQYKKEAQRIEKEINKVKNNSIKRTDKFMKLINHNEEVVNNDGVVVYIVKKLFRR